MCGVNENEWAGFLQVKPREMQHGEAFSSLQCAHGIRSLITQVGSAHGLDKSGKKAFKKAQETHISIEGFRHDARHRLCEREVQAPVRYFTYAVSAIFEYI